MKIGVIYKDFQNEHEFILKESSYEIKEKIVNGKRFVDSVILHNGEYSLKVTDDPNEKAVELELENISINAKLNETDVDIFINIERNNFCRIFVSDKIETEITTKILKI